MNRATAVCRLLAALLVVVALIGRYLYGLGYITFSTGNYFAYLTIQSNLAAGVVLALGAVRAWRNRADSARFAAIRLLATCHLVVAGSVFIVLVVESPKYGYPIDVPWSDVVLHFVMPAIAIADWALAPGRHRTGWRLVPLALAYPVVWGLATLARGQVVGWYPYFFLDPYQVGSPLEFVAYSVAALAVFVLVATLLTVVDRTVPPLDARRRRR